MVRRVSAAAERAMRCVGASYKRPGWSHQSGDSFGFAADRAFEMFPFPPRPEDAVRGSVAEQTLGVGNLRLDHDGRVTYHRRGTDVGIPPRHPRSIATSCCPTRLRRRDTRGRHSGPPTDVPRAANRVPMRLPATTWHHRNSDKLDALFDVALLIGLRKPLIVDVGP